MPNLKFESLEMQPKSVYGDANVHAENADIRPKDNAVNSTNETADIEKSEAVGNRSGCDNENCIVTANIVAITKSQLTSGSSPRFMFIVELKWSDGHTSYIARDHDDFFRYHCWLLDTFQEEAGYAKSGRQIPLLPGKKFFRNDLSLAEERKPLLNAYLSGVIKLKRISESTRAQAFFKRRPGDPNDDEPLLKQNDAETSSIGENAKLFPNDQQPQGTIMLSIPLQTINYHFCVDSEMFYRPFCLKVSSTKDLNTFLQHVDYEVMNHGTMN